MNNRMKRTKENKEGRKKSEGGGENERGEGRRKEGNLKQAMNHVKDLSAKHT